MTVSSPAKVNFILRILDRRPDGYHNLWSLMQTVSLADDLTVVRDPCTTDIRLTCAHPEVPRGPENLIHRAATAVLARAGMNVGLEVRLIKRIPMGAGLGGGSSNAAATVLALNRLLRLGWTPTAMAETAQHLGSDVPFFFFAPSAVVAGRGERVQPLRIPDGRALLLVNPGFGVATQWAYQALAAGRTKGPELPKALRQLTSLPTLGWDEVAPLMGNDFEPVVFPQYRVLGTIKVLLQQAGAEAALLSGTGATVFGIFATTESAVRAQQQIEHQQNWRSWVVHTESGGLTVVDAS